MFCAGIAVDKDGVVYFADGANIRAIDEAGNIRTLIGSQSAPGHWAPFPCRTVLNVSQVLHVDIFYLSNLINYVSRISHVG